MLVLVEEPAGKVPHPGVGLPPAPSEHDAPAVVGAEGADGGRRVRINDVPAGATLGTAVSRLDFRPAARAEAPFVEQSHYGAAISACASGANVVPMFGPATVAR